MQRVINEMAKAKDDVERRLRIHIPDIIKECLAFGYLGKKFTFDVSDLSDRVNARLIALSDDILSDIESRARKAAECAEEEEEWLPLILPYISRQIGEEDMVTRLDKHCSTLRYFLEGWIAIGMVNKLQEYEITNNVLRYIDNPLASPLWQEALNAGYLSAAISRGDYVFGKGNQRNVLKALTEVEQYAINEAFQYGRIIHYGKMGAIGYRTHRNSTYDCPHCDELTMVIHPLDSIVLPAHPRCVCFSTPIYVGDDGANMFLREQKYQRLLTDPDYKNVAFDKANGGLKATHIHHNLDKKGGIYELAVQNAGFNAGHEVILESEWFKGFGVRSTEGIWDGRQFEVAGCETATSNNILRGLKHCASKKETQIAVLDFPNGGYDIDVLTQSIKRYRGLESRNDGQYLKFEKLICVQDNRIVYEGDF